MCPIMDMVSSVFGIDDDDNEADDQTNAPQCVSVSSASDTFIRYPDTNERARLMLFSASSVVVHFCIYKCTRNEIIWYLATPTETRFERGVQPLKANPPNKTQHAPWKCKSAQTLWPIQFVWTLCATLLILGVFWGSGVWSFWGRSQTVLYNLSRPCCDTCFRCLNTPTE